MPDPSQCTASDVRMTRSTSVRPVSTRPVSGLAISLLAFAALTLTLLPVTALASQPGKPLPPEDPARELSLLLRSLDRTARVLYVTAHPDDEDAGLISRMVHGQGIEVALLTLTRGEGGQNEIGAELFDELGVLRSRELQAASRYAGFQQYYSRAFEFGYSFSPEETYEKWGKEEILRDIVQVMRQERADVVLTMLNDGPGGGQHHQASARLTAEALEIASTKEWPELGPAHQASRLFRQIWSEDSPHTAHCEVELGTYDPVLGASYQEMGLTSRGMHKCQGMARLSDPMPSRLSRWHWALADQEVTGQLNDHFERFPEPLLDGVSAPTNFGTALRTLVSEIRRTQKSEGPKELTEALLRYHDLVQSELSATTSATDRLRLQTLLSRAARAIQLAAGLRIEARTPGRFVSAGTAVPATLSFENNGPFRIAIDSGWSGNGIAEVSAVIMNPQGAVVLEPGQRSTQEIGFALRPDAQSTLPFPMPRHGSGVQEADPKRVLARYLNPRWEAFSYVPELRIENRSVQLPAIHLVTEDIDARFPRTFFADTHIVPDPSARMSKPRVAVPVSGGGSGATEVEVWVSSLSGGPVEVSLHEVAEGGTGGVQIAPASQVIETRAGGTEQAVRFQVSVPIQEINGSEQLPTFAIEAEVRYTGPDHVTRPSREGYQRVEYPHLRPGALVKPARTDLVSFSCQTTPRRIGFIAGSGDQTLAALQRLGYAPVVLERENLERDLSEFDVIITGVRMYKVREDVKDNHPKLLKWMEDGGTLIVQYNKFEFNDGNEEQSPFAPYPGAKVGRRRVTVEESPVRLNDPNHSVFNQPNTIGEADWAHWVQERGLYFLDVTDPRYNDLLTLADPWELNAGDKGGSLVHARYGNGHWVYVGIGLFRQLPAGVPGAYRILANLLALGAE